MSDSNDEKGRCQPNMECLGGHAFLLLAVGIFCLLPGSILMAIYGDAQESSAIRIGTYFLFICGASFLLIGFMLIIFWCQKSGYKSAPGKSPDAEEAANKVTNGKMKDGNVKSKEQDKLHGDASVKGRQL